MVGIEYIIIGIVLLVIVAALTGNANALSLLSQLTRANTDIQTARMNIAAKSTTLFDKILLAGVLLLFFVVFVLAAWKWWTKEDDVPPKAK